jgi:hypothetical protein
MIDNIKLTLVAGQLGQFQYGRLSFATANKARSHLEFFNVESQDLRSPAPTAQFPPPPGTLGRGDVATRRFGTHTYTAMYAPLAQVGGRRGDPSSAALKISLTSNKQTPWRDEEPQMKANRAYV